MSIISRVYNEFTRKGNLVGTVECFRHSMDTETLYVVTLTVTDCESSGTYGHYTERVVTDRFPYATEAYRAADLLFDNIKQTSRSGGVANNATLYNHLVDCGAITHSPTACPLITRFLCNSSKSLSKRLGLAALQHGPKPPRTKQARMTSTTAKKGK